MDLDQYFYSYPQEDDPDLQGKLAARKEFAELKADRDSDVRTLQGYFKHQEIVNRYMRIYDRLFLIWEPGAGKTIGSLGSAEQFRRLRNQNQTYQRSYPETYYQPVHTNIQQAIVIVKSKQQIPIFRDSIYRITRDLSTKLEIKHDGFYRFKTYQSFYKELRSLVSNPRKGFTPREEEILRNKYENTFFIIDEIHNINPSIKKERKNGEYSYTDIYYSVLNLFRLLDQVKIMGLTATPITDKVNEAAYLINIILKKKEMPTSLQEYTTPKQYSIDFPIPKKKIQEYFRGRISFIRVRFPGVEIETVGENLNLGIDLDGYKIKNRDYFEPRITRGVDYTILSKRYDPKGEKFIDIKEHIEDDNFIQTSIKTVKSYMDGYQLAAYYQEIERQRGIYERREKNIRSLEGERIQTLSYNEQKIRNFVFPPSPESPEIKYGSEAIENELVSKRKYLKRIGDTISFTENFKRDFLSPEGVPLRYLSSVYHEALQIIEDHLENKNGIIFAFFNLVEWGSQIFEALVRAKFGMERYVYSGDRLRKKKLRVVYLTGDDTKIKNTLDLVSSPQNWNGDYIKIVIGSSVITESYNIFHATTILVMEPWWNFARTYQGVRRGIRQDGFEEIKKQMSPQKVSVKIYSLVALFETEEKNPRVDTDTIDTRKIFISLAKDWKNATMIRWMKESAFDCLLNRPINYHPDDQDYSSDCAYRKCEFRCNTRKYSDTSQTYYILYLEDKKEEVISILQQVFRQTDIVKIETVLKYMEREFKDYTLVVQLVTSIVQEHRPFLNRFGFTKYLFDRNGYLFLNNTLDGREDFNAIWYSVNFNLSYQKSLWSYFDPLVHRKIDRITRGLSREKYQGLFKKSNLIDRIYMMERSIISLARDQEYTEADRWLLNYLDHYYLQRRKPIDIIENARKKMYTVRQGQRPAAGYWSIGDEDWEAIKKNNTQVGSTIYLHYAFIFSASAAASSSGLHRFDNRIRILEPPYREWKTIQTNQRVVEQQVYRRIINDQIEAWKSEFEALIRGHFPKDHYSHEVVPHSYSPIYLNRNPFTEKFKIVTGSWFRQLHFESSQSKGKRTMDPNDKRGVSKGRDIKNLKPAEWRSIYPYFFFEKGDPKPVDNPVNQIKNRMIRLGLYTFMYN